MGRDLSYAYISSEDIQKVIEKFGDREKLQDCLTFHYEAPEELSLDWIEEPRFRNYVSAMTRQIFTYTELMRYITKRCQAGDFQEVEALSEIIDDMEDGSYVIISSE